MPVYVFIRFAVGLDIDDEALEVCSRNLQEFEIKKVDLVQLDLTSVGPEVTRFHRTFDTVIMNPPFGTKHNPGMYLTQSD